MQSYRCWAEVDLNALRENLAWLRHRVGPEVKILTVVKADAYGHGLKQIAAALMQSGTDIFGVANLAEAHAIRSVGRGWPILMLGACLPHEVETAVRDHVMPTISSVAEVAAFSATATRLGKLVDVHVKVDTGMGRLGAAPGEAGELIRKVIASPALRLAGLYTHFSSAEDDRAFTAAQRHKFAALVAQLRRDGISVPLIHACNSAGVLHEPKSFSNLVRPGLLVYGIVPRSRRRAAVALQRTLRPALTWKCRVSLVKKIAKGTPLSYGHTFVAPGPMRVATITAGYGDGYLRAGSNRAEVLIHGRRCRVLGRVTMDQMLVDVSRVAAVKAGDEVVLIGRHRAREITAHDLADWFGTIPWEVLTAITYRVPRIYKGASAA
ncbi:MAG: alanine racemase [Verrucomicrobia bacterium]|nr:alanine racemase [Verrucomicrobiota bacterium]